MSDPGTGVTAAWPATVAGRVWVRRRLREVERASVCQVGVGGFDEKVRERLVGGDGVVEERFGVVVG